MSNSNLLQLIKQAAVEVIEASTPSDIHVGHIKSINPFVLHVADVDIPHDFIVIADSLSNNLDIDDKVIVITNRGGQLFCIIDKAVNL